MQSLSKKNVMEDILKEVSVSEYHIFRKECMERLNWNRTQYNDRRNGRIKIHPLELEVIRHIVSELPSHITSES